LPAANVPASVLRNRLRLDIETERPTESSVSRPLVVSDSAARGTG
jgi:hypothetical protein